MRLLVATHRTNGSQPGDYDFCIEGELVYMQDPCDSDLRNPDGPCGCGRGFAGMNSHRGTTTAMVVESTLTGREVRGALRASLEAGGWLNPSLCTSRQAGDLITSALADVSTLAQAFALGSIVRRRLDRYTGSPAA